MLHTWLSYSFAEMLRASTTTIAKFSTLYVRGRARVCPWIVTGHPPFLRIRSRRPQISAPKPIQPMQRDQHLHRCNLNIAIANIYWGIASFIIT